MQPLSPFMSLLRGVFISLYFLYQNKFTADFFVLSFNNWALMLIASICTAYAFTASVKVMKN
jgi:hypothetical protein